MSEERIDQLMRRMAQETYNPPAPPPREEMWIAIQAARRGELGRRAALREARLRRRATWAAGIAAALLVGIGLGRISVGPGPAAAPPTARLAGPARPSTAHQVATAQHLSRAEALLTSVRSGAQAGGVDAELRAWARDLLSTTRLMLDSRAAEEPRTRVLLEDLELILAQVTQLPAAQDTPAARQELALVRQAMEEADVLPKLRTAIPAGAPEVLTDE